MMLYSIFGLRVESPIALDGLLPESTADVPDVRILLADAAHVAQHPHGQVIGADPRAPCFVRWCRDEGTDRLTHQCAGTYVISRESAPRDTELNAPFDVTIVPNSDAPSGTLRSTLRMDILGRVLPLVLHRRNILCLHAGAVELGGEALVLVAAKGTGKSTLSVALVAAGALPLADDAVAVRLTDAPAVWPGVRSARVLPDTHAHVDALAWQEMDVLDGKYRLAPQPGQSTSAVPLGAVYLLEPAAPDAPQAAVRERLTGHGALVGLLGHGKLGSLMGGAQAAAELARMASLAQQVPVYRLAIARDLARLDEVAETVRGWHGVNAMERS